MFARLSPKASMRRIQLLVLLLLACSSVFASSPQASTQRRMVTLKGRVVDARTGEAIGKAKVIANAVDQSTTTDDNGGFTLENLAVGQLDLYITTVNYGLVKKTVTLREENNEFRIALNEDAAALTESVTINARPFETSQTNAASERSE